MGYIFLCMVLVSGISVLTIVGGMFYTVDQQHVAMIERFGRYIKQSNAGLGIKIPLIDKVSGRVSLRVQQLDVRAETKTKDNVFVNVVISVQYFVIPEKVYDAFYKLNDPEVQINSYVFDVVRARVPSITVDQLFEKKDEIAVAVAEELNETMNDFGFEILNALVTDIDPDPKVKSAMNEINAAERLKIAATEKGEADKILQVKSAEADAESKALQGKGIADQRMAIVDGLRESVTDFQNEVEGSTAQDVMNLVLLTQYFDTLKDLGDNSNTKTILIPHSPGGMSDLSSQIREAIMTGSDAVNNDPKPVKKTQKPSMSPTE